MTSFELDTRSFNRAMREFASVTKRGLVDVGMSAAKGFVKRAVEITPPAQGKLAGAKQIGEKAIARDIARVMTPVRRKTEHSAEDLHKRFRSQRTGRVNPGRLKEPYRVKYGEYAALAKKLKTRVGLLAAGWAAPASKLGLRLPGWITRHGAGRSAVTITLASGGITIDMANKVPFAGNVRGLKSRVHAALKYQEGALRRQINHLLDKAMRKAFL